MYDLAISLGTGIAALAEVAELLGQAGISIEGGGAWGGAGSMVAHFLVQDGASARAALVAGGMADIELRPVLIQRLDQERPGQLGRFARRMAEGGVRIEVLYSDHANRLIVVVDDAVRGAAISAAWELERSSGQY